MANSDETRVDRRDGEVPGRVVLLGPPSATWGGAPLLLPDRIFAVVAYLVSQPRLTARRDTVRNLVFDGAEPAKANNAFRQCLSRLRRLQEDLGVELLTTDGDALSLRTEAFGFDLLDFSRADPMGLPRAGQTQSVQAFFDLYGGDLLEGSRTTAGPFDDWLRVQRQKIAERFLGVAHRVLDADAGLADDDLLGLARRVARMQPESVSACTAAIRVNLRLQRRMAARRVFDDYVGLMAREFGGQVAPEVMALGAALDFGKAAPDGREPVTIVPDPRAAPVPAPDRAARGCPRVLILPPVSVLRDEAASRLAQAFVEDVTVGLARYRSFTIIGHHTARSFSQDMVQQARPASSLADFTIATALKPTPRGLAMTFRITDAAADEVVSVSEVDWHHDDLTRVFTYLVSKVVQFIVDTLEVRTLRLPMVPGDTSAYRLYLEGRQSLSSIDLPHLRRAKRWFRDAANRSPDYAAPLFGLARATLMEWFVVGMPEGSSLSDAEALADRGLRLDPFDWRGLREKALANLWLRQHDLCIDLFERAMLLGPNDADLIADYADALAHCGEPERGLELHSRAVELNPLHPDYYTWIKGSILFQTGQYEAALETMERIRHNPATARLLAACSAKAGRPEDARSHVQTLREVYPDFRADQLWRVSPNRRAQDTAHFVDALRLAGVE